MLLSVLRRLREIKKSDCESRQVCLYVLPTAWINWAAPTGRIFTKSGISLFFENLSRKLKFR